MELVGFDSLIRDLIKTTRIQGEVSIQAASYREGSIIVDALVYIKDYVEQLPFEKIDELLEFLKIANAVAWEKAVRYFNEIKPGYRTLNDYFVNYPLDLALLTIVIVELIDRAKKFKKQPNIQNDDLPEKIAQELHKRINKHAFKLALKPIVDDKISSIEVSPDKDFKRSAIIDQNNFHNYLGEDDMILPHLENSGIYNFKGKVTSLKSTRGDSLTFKYVYKSKDYNLDLLPPDGDTTKSYTDYYKEKVNLKAEVIRVSLYKKPKLKLISIELQQMLLFEE